MKVVCRDKIVYLLKSVDDFIMSFKIQGTLQFNRKSNVDAGDFQQESFL
jgi:hypothetical protein